MLRKEGVGGVDEAVCTKLSYMIIVRCCCAFFSTDLILAEPFKMPYRVDFQILIMFMQLFEMTICILYVFILTV